MLVLTSVRGTGNEFYGALSSDRSGSPARAVNARDNRRMYTWENLLFYNKTFKKIIL